LLDHLRQDFTTFPKVDVMINVGTNFSLNLQNCKI